GSGRSRRRGSPMTRRGRPRPGRCPVRARPGGCRGRRSRTRSRSRRSRQWCGTSGRRGRASRWRRSLGAAPSVLCDRDELLDGGVELFLACALDALAQHLEDLRLRPAVDEDDEAEAEALLVLAVEALELVQDLRIGVGALLGGRAGREAGALADRRVRVQGLELL